MGFLDDAFDVYKKAVGYGVSAMPVVPGNPGSGNLGTLNAIRNFAGDQLGLKNEGPSAPPQQQSRGGGGGGMGLGKHPILRYIMRTNPEVTSLDQARKIRDNYRMDQLLPGLADFARQETGTPDPNTMQMFFAKTVQPYLQQANQQYQQGADAGYAAMQKILSNSASSPGLDIIKQFLPVQQAGVQQMGAALDAATRTGPAYDALLNQLNENIQQQQRAAYLAQVAAAGGGGQQQQGSSFGQAVVAGAQPK